MTRTVERARGRWPFILRELGLEASFLANRHGPCPLCGGKDRYRFDDRDGAGTYYCNQCGPGSGMTLAMRLMKADFKTTATRIDQIVGNAAPSAPRSPQPPDESARRLRKLEHVLRQAKSPDIVAAYLHGRGLSAAPAVLRGHPALWNTEIEACIPAMLAPVVDVAGGLQSVQRTYIDRGLKTRRKMMTPVRTIAGCAIRLFAADIELGVAEGIENAIAARELFGLPVWAAMSAQELRSFDIPADIEHLTIYADNDENFVGQRAAFDLAQRAQNSVDDVAVKIPPTPGTDWNDVLRGQI